MLCTQDVMVEVGYAAGAVIGWDRDLVVPGELGVCTENLI